MAQIDYFTESWLFGDQSFSDQNNESTMSLFDDKPLEKFLIDNTSSPAWPYTKTPKDEIDELLDQNEHIISAFFNTQITGEMNDLASLFDLDQYFNSQPELNVAPKTFPTRYNRIVKDEAVSFDNTLGSTTPSTKTTLASNMINSDDNQEKAPLKITKRRYTRRRPLKPRKNKIRKRRSNRTIHLWEFLKDLLNSGNSSKYIQWINKKEGTFRLLNSSAVAKLWGERKNRQNMTYEKMSRALRYYYEKEILERVPNARLIYKFGEKTKTGSIDDDESSDFGSEENL